MPFDRVTTGTKRVVEFLEGPDGGAGLFKELKVDGYNKSNGNKFVRIEAKPKGTIIKVDYQPDVSDANITKIWKALTKKYGLVDGPKVGPNILQFILEQMMRKEMLKRFGLKKLNLEVVELFLQIYRRREQLLYLPMH